MDYYSVKTQEESSDIDELALYFGPIWFDNKCGFAYHNEGR